MYHHLIVFLFLTLYSSSILAGALATTVAPIFGEAHFLDRSGADIGRIADVTQDKRGVIYFATAGGIQEFDGITWTSVIGSEKKSFTVLGQGENGRIYAAGQNDFGVLVPDSNGIMTFQSYAALVAEGSKKFAQDFIKVIATSKEAIFLTESSIFSVALTGGDPSVHDVTIQDRFFTASVVGDEAVVLTDKDGLQSWRNGKLEPIRGGNFFRTFALTSRDGTKLVAGTSEGILELSIKDDSVSFEQIPYSDASLIHGRAIRRVELSHGVYYLGMDSGGVVRVAHDGTVTQWSDDQREALGAELYTHLVDRDGRLWFVTEKGLGLFAAMPEAVQKALNPKDTRVFLRRITGTKDNSVFFGGVYFSEAGGVPTLDPTKLNFSRIAFDDNALRFEIATDSPGLAQQLEYQTKLEGLDDDWSEASKRNTREFTNLIWKKYDFKMRVKFADGTLSSEFSFPFKVDPPWYEQWWFYGLEAAIFLSSMLLVVYIRVRQRFLHAEEPINVTIISTALGYTFTKVGAYSAIDAISGGAAFMSILLSSFLGIFLKPIERQIEKFVYRCEKWLEEHPQVRTAMLGKKSPGKGAVAAPASSGEPPTVDKSA